MGPDREGLQHRQPICGKRARSLKYLDHAPVITLSALKGTRAVKLFALIDDLARCYAKRVSTAELNRFLEAVTAQNPPGTHRRGRRIKMTFRRKPPALRRPLFSFATILNRSIFPTKGFLENRLRETFEFDGAPLRLFFRKRLSKSAEPGTRQRSLR